MSAVDAFERERSRLFGLAYRMTGSVMDADDIVQDAYLRWQGVDADRVETPAAFLTTVTTRLSIDRLRSAQRKRETYVGPWLPEPIVTENDPARVVEVDETITLSFLAVLERLNPVDRAVFLLREVFGTSYDEIARVVDRSETACRQIARRARERVRNERPRFELPSARTDELVAAFGAALLSGDPEQLSALLADDVVHVSDGGADHHAARRPVVGAANVARFMVNLAKRFPSHGEIEVLEANGDPAFLALVDGEPVTLVALGFDRDLVRRVSAVVNPDKLAEVMAARDRLAPRTAT